MMKKLLITALMLAGVSNINAAPATATGNVKFTVVVPEIIVLYHWDEANLTLTPDAGFTYADSNAHDSSAVLTSGGVYDITQNAVDTNTNNPLSTANKLTVNLKNSWGVRSITTNNPTLALTNPNGTNLKSNSGSDLIVISDQKLICTNTADCSVPAGSLTQTIAKSWTPKTGDIQFKLDLSAITTSGKYSSLGTDSETFTLTFTAVP